MQIIFRTHQTPQEYCADSSKFCGEYPEAPAKCPFKGCGVPVPMKKHGYYRRYLISLGFSGDIKIRRYKCRKCRHTVSMLPFFCIPLYTYGVDLVVGLMRKAVESRSIRKAAKTFNEASSGISRKQVRQYLSRLRKNRVLIQYGLDQISPGMARFGDSPGDMEWTRRILLGNRPTLSAESNAEFHKATGISFMSTRNRIA